MLPGTVLKLLIYKKDWSKKKSNTLFALIWMCHFFLIYCIINKNPGQFLIVVNFTLSVSHTVYRVYFCNRDGFDGKYIYSFTYNFRIVITTFGLEYVQLELYCWFAVVIVYIFVNHHNDSDKIIIIYTIPLDVGDIYRKKKIHTHTVINEVLNLITIYFLGFVIDIYPHVRNVYCTACICSIFLNVFFTVSVKSAVVALIIKICILISMIMDKNNVPMNIFSGVLGILYYINENLNQNNNIFKSIVVDAITFAILLSMDNYNA